ncbi:unnamed protein product (macronuclear) [Paramecium tetraurelia]|uniref:Mitochondrial import inner membrane translocase subunit TIM50 n=1 Tax=Paramecium tetraurelia TaxID=5888 RepID=A0DQ43_PARTE|nr:uncharacterized protein GSPATT00002560001 [Paramecium tetraurelia]CAK85160.1 unnamed protein product [Paramecium tetraurelia]|eukprot:XP_001452557.1 hypothetical protein (macronuclear) [Paramecium tetraurelia strain d4-2]
MEIITKRCIQQSQLFQPQLSKLAQQLNRNRTQSNITISKQVKITNQSISRIKLESIKSDSNNDTSYQNDEKSKQKVIAASRSGQFTRKVNLNNQVYIKKVYQGNYFFDKIKEILKSGLKDNTSLKKMSRDALNQIHMIMTYQEIIPEVSLLYYGKSQKQIKIVFDLDETLVHSEEVQKDKVYDFQNNEFGLFVRPYCCHVLKELSQLADLFVYTSANQKYAKTIINLIDPENTFFKGHFYRNNCVSLQSKMQIKHLGILSNNYSKIVIIDNSPIFYMGQPYNGIPIAPFIDDPQDNELPKLLSFLIEKILQSDDVRVTIRRFFQYDMFRQFSDGVSAFNILYN